MESRFLLNSLEIDVTLKFLFTDSKLPDTVTHCDTVCLSQDCTKIDSYTSSTNAFFTLLHIQFVFLRPISNQLLSRNVDSPFVDLEQKGGIFLLVG